MSRERAERRVKFLPRIGLLLLLNLIPAIPADHPLFLIGVLVPSLVYTAVLILSTRDTVRLADRLSPADLWLFRLSGPGAILVTLVPFILLGILEPNFDVNPRYTVLLGHFVLELGIVLATACLACGAGIRHVPPTVIWKIISAPLLLVYVVLLVVSMMTTMGE